MNAFFRPTPPHQLHKLTAYERICREADMLLQLRTAITAWSPDRMRIELATCQDTIREGLRACAGAEPENLQSLVWWLGRSALKASVLQSAIEERAGV